MSSTKPYLDKLKQLLNSIERDARLTYEDKRHLLDQFEGLIAVSALRKRRRLLPPPKREAPRRLNGQAHEFIEIITNGHEH